MRSRQVKRLHPALRDDIGDLVTRRPLPGPALPDLDPFLFLNHHGPQVYSAGNRGLPFGPHPHRGFETVTFILAGELSHLDSGGHESVIHAGGVQWMTAGRGLVHAELSPDSFKQEGGPLEILQLWINLPARLKMTAPAYVGLEANDIPSVEIAKGRLHLVSEQWDGIEGPIKPIADIRLMTVRLDAGGTVDIPVPAGRTIFLYVVAGEGQVGGVPVPAHHLAEFADDGEGVSIAAPAGATILFGHGAPFREPIVSHGPFVMNSREEIVAAVQDYQAGRFGHL
ncbi:pirin family protein [Sphingosinicella sp. BN140058]|uniref:pirin family protein n=1 Tax=Sphingosinicella sp. BN140058 TaxID=1892855 RepID=UPI001011A177|nr:pirin family protein [Sphingosinicella sp. BN140058]QAY77386.1 pirin family protein [Sphingosinicella sp. BN140058]